MELNQQKRDDVNLIKSVSSHSIEINGATFSHSLIVSNNAIISPLKLTNTDELNTDHIDQLLTSNPEIVLLGSGDSHTFPDVNLLQAIAKQNIGFEVMNNQSASRTYNVLVSEERKVACLLILNQ